MMGAIIDSKPGVFPMTAAQPHSPKKECPAKKKASKPSASSQAGAKPAVGDAAVDFSLPDQTGRNHRLSDCRGQWVVLYFYPKDNTSGCTAQACQFRDRQPTFQKANAVVWGVSPDSVESHARFVEKQGLNFSLLADVGSRVCTQYGVWQEKSMYGRRYMGVVRTTLLIDPAGGVAYRWDKVSVPGHEQQVLAQLTLLQQAFSRSS